jgi:hypothetical protein
MLNRELVEPNYGVRHVVTCLAVHNFDHKVCYLKSFHIPNDNFMCNLWGVVCGRYHIMICKQRTQPLIAYAEDD